MFFWNLLTSVSASTSSGEVAKNLSFWDKYGMMILVGAFLVLLILGMTWSSRKRRKQQEEQMEKISALGAGTKIETIGGIFGTIVEMNKEDGTFVLETGSDKFGKSYLLFDRNAIARIITPIENVAKEEPEIVEDEAPEFAPVAEENAAEKTEE